MPRATADTTKTARFDLDTVEGGFVELRKLTYGDQLHMQEISAQMSSQQNGQVRGAAGLSIDYKATAAQVFNFSKSIVNHNLEDENGRKLNLHSGADVAKLDVTVGNEIEDKITQFNSKEEPPFSQTSPTEPTSSVPMEVAAQ